MTGPTVRFTVDLGRRRARTVVASAPPRAAPAAHPPAEPAAPTAPVTTAARTLALAHFIEREVRAGRFMSYRDAARHLGVSHRRVQHVVGLLLLPATVQAALLVGRSETGERDLRRLAAPPIWSAETRSAPPRNEQGAGPGNE